MTDDLWNGSDLSCQPCTAYQPVDAPYQGCQRVNPLIDLEVCHLEVRFCRNCLSLHHAGGWNACRRPGVCTRMHPLCQKS